MPRSGRHPAATRRTGCSSWSARRRSGTGWPRSTPYRYYVASGGLVSYGPDPIDQYRRAAGYIDRVLKGDKPGDLPVQAPTKYELAVNLKAIGVGANRPGDNLFSSSIVALHLDGTYAWHFHCGPGWPVLK